MKFKVTKDVHAGINHAYAGLILEGEPVEEEDSKIEKFCKRILEEKPQQKKIGKLWTPKIYAEWERLDESEKNFFILDIANKVNELIDRNNEKTTD